MGGYRPLTVAVDTATDTVYVGGYDGASPSISSAVFVIDGATGVVSATILERPTSYPIAVAVDQADGTVDVVNRLTRDITVIASATEKVTTTIAFPGGIPYAIAADQRTGVSYVSGSMTGASRGHIGLWTINDATDAITGPVDLGAGDSTPGPADLAVNDATGLIYAGTGAMISGGGTGLKVISAATGKIVDSIPISPFALGLDPATDTIYAEISGWPGWTHLIDGATGAEIALLPRGGATVAIDPARQAVFLTNGGGGGTLWTLRPAATTTMSPVVTPLTNATFTAGTAGGVAVTASAAPAATFTEAGKLPAGLGFSESGFLAGTPAAGSGGAYSLAVTASNGITPADTGQLNVTVNEAPAITSPARATFHTSVSGLAVLLTRGYPAPAFAVTGTLPAGVVLVPASDPLPGLPVNSLAGIPGPNAGGIYHLVITASNSLGQARQDFTLTVDQPLAFTSARAVTLTAGRKGSFTVTTSGFPVATLTRTGTQPKGLAFRNLGGGKALISGTPAASAKGRSFVIRITARDSAGSTAAQTLAIKVR